MASLLLKLNRCLFLSKPRLPINNRSCLSLIGGRNFERNVDQTSNRQKGRLEKPKLVIFDKDGTLICFHSMAWWIEDFVRQLHSITGVDVNALYKLLHYDVDSERVSNDSVIARCTNQQIIDLVSTHLNNDCKISMLDARRIVDRTFQEITIEQSPNPSIINKPLGNVEELFHELANVHNIKLAVCTSDSRHSTVDALQVLKVFNLVEIIICGDDHNNVPKPNAFNAIKICTALNVEPSHACIIGDTTADVIMGRNANLGSVLGVLSGVGTHDDLEPYADGILDDIHGINNYFRL